MSERRVVPVIMAGGSGTRLWPMSRPDMPKQFLRLAGTDSLFQLAVKRGCKLQEAAPPIVIGSEKHSVRIESELRALGAKAQVVLEPSGRNTAAAVAVAAILAEPGDILLVLSADQYMPDLEAFEAHVRKASQVLGERELATLSVRPHYPATQFGYVELSEPHRSGFGYQVSRFIEKPDAATAGQYIRSGRFLWNSGIFMFPVGVLREKLAELLPDVWSAAQAAVSEGRAVASADTPLVLGASFLTSPSISIDVGVMEKTGSVTFPYNGEWSDLGTWEAIREHLGEHGTGNAVRGDVEVIATRRSVVMGSSRLVVAANLTDTVVVETADAVFVGRLNLGEHDADEGTMRKVVQRLVENGRQEASESTDDVRPWGHYATVHQDSDCRVKRIVVQPSCRLSLQSHERRDETWVVVRGAIEVTLNDSVTTLKSGEVLQIPRKSRHRIANTGTAEAVLIEVQTGDYFGEDDIVRFEDDYGRAGA